MNKLDEKSKSITKQSYTVYRDELSKLELLRLEDLLAKKFFYNWHRVHSYMLYDITTTKE